MIGQRSVNGAPTGADARTGLRHPANDWAAVVGGGWIFLLLVALVALFAGLKPAQFGSTYNLSMLAVNAAILLVLAVGQTFVIIAAGIDLAVGTILVFASVASAKTMLLLSGAPSSTFGTTDAGWAVVLIGLVVAVLAGMAWGTLNGVLIAVARIPALIVTLGTFGMALGSAQILTGGQDVRAVPERLVVAVGSGEIAGVPVLVAVAIVVALGAAILLHLTRFGSRTFAVGSRVEAARRAGIPVRRQLILVYVLSGALAGLGGMMSIARFSTTTIGRPQHGQPRHDLGRGAGRIQSVRWLGKHHRNGRRRVHPDRPAQRIHHPRHPALLADCGHGCRPDPRGLDRSAEAAVPATRLSSRQP